MQKDLARLVTVLKSEKKPTAKLLEKVQPLLSPQTYAKITKYIAGDKRVSVKKMIDDIIKTIQKGGIYMMSIDKVHVSRTEGEWIPMSVDGAYLQEPSVPTRPVRTQSQSIIHFRGMKYTTEKLLGEGTFARVYELVSEASRVSEDYVVKIFKDPQAERIQATLVNLRNIKGYLTGLDFMNQQQRPDFKIYNSTTEVPATTDEYITPPSKIPTSFVDGDIDGDINSSPPCVILNKMEGSLTDYMDCYIKLAHIQYYIDLLKTCIVDVQSMIKQYQKYTPPNSGTIGLIHGDMKLDNLLWKGDYCYLHDFDGALLFHNPIDRKYHAFTVGCTHPLYYVFRELYYPRKSKDEVLSPGIQNLTMYQILNIYMSRGKFTDSLKFLYNQLYAYLLDNNEEATLDPQNLIVNFAMIARNQNIVGAANPASPLETNINNRYNNTSWEIGVQRWLPHFDNFSLLMSVFIRATAWLGTYRDHNVQQQILAHLGAPDHGFIIAADNLIFTFCAETLENLKNLVSTVDNGEHKGGAPSRKTKFRKTKVKRMPGGGPKKFALDIPRFKEIMSSENLMMDNIFKHNPDHDDSKGRKNKIAITLEQQKK